MEGLRDECRGHTQCFVERGRVSFFLRFSLNRFCIRWRKGNVQGRRCTFSSEFLREDEDGSRRRGDGISARSCYRENRARVWKATSGKTEHHHSSENETRERRGVQCGRRSGAHANICGRPCKRNHQHSRKKSIRHISYLGEGCDDSIPDGSSYGRGAGIECIAFEACRFS